MDIHWDIEVTIPQLEGLTQTMRELGVQLMESMENIVAQLDRLAEGQASMSEGLAEQLQAIAREVAQWSPGVVTQEQMDSLGMRLTQAADTAVQQAADVRSNASLISGIIPDEPAPVEPPVEEPPPEEPSPERA
jgi:hypothetical protein